jgi:hypothetical protein
LGYKPSLKKLNFSSVEGRRKNKITAEGVANLKKIFNMPHCSLLSLEMDFINLGNEGVVTAFEDMRSPPLEVLSLNRNEISCKNVMPFCCGISNTSLIKLDLSKNNLSNIGVKILTDVLGLSYGRNRLSKSLAYLNLSNNSITSLGF